MNTDKIYAEHLANEYAPGYFQKWLPCKLDARPNCRDGVHLRVWHRSRAGHRGGHVFVHGSYRQRHHWPVMALGIVIGLAGSGNGRNFVLSTKAAGRQGKQKYAT